MNKTKLYVSRYLVLLALILSAYLILNYLDVLLLKKSNILVITTIIAIVFALGVLIIAPSLNKDPEKFALSFILLTTIQMLLAMSVIGVIFYLKFAEFKMFGFHFLGLFCINLFVQSFLLIRINN